MVWRAIFARPNLRSKVALSFQLVLEGGLGLRCRRRRRVAAF
jgi:hypothetical protein